MVLFSSFKKYWRRIAIIPGRVFRALLEVDFQIMDAAPSKNKNNFSEAAQPISNSTENTLSYNIAKKWTLHRELR